MAEPVMHSFTTSGRDGYDFLHMTTAEDSSVVRDAGWSVLLAGDGGKSRRIGSPEEMVIRWCSSFGLTTRGEIEMVLLSSDVYVDVEDGLCVIVKRWRLLMGLTKHNQWAFNGLTKMDKERQYEKVLELNTHIYCVLCRWINK